MRQTGCRGNEVEETARSKLNTLLTLRFYTQSAVGVESSAVCRGSRPRLAQQEESERKREG